MQTQLFPGYTIGTDAYDYIKTICPRYGKKAAVIGGERALKAASGKIQAAAEYTGIEFTGVFWYGGESSLENVERLAAEPGVREADMIFAVGGGKAIDTAKILAQRSERPFFTFPTIASTCASATGLGILYHPDGSLREYSFSDIPAVHIFIDSQMIADAPAKYFWAGIGDSMAKYFECTTSGRGLTLSHSDAFGTAMSHMCGEPFIKYGKQALEDCRNHQVTPAFEEIILGIIVSTGFTSNLIVVDLTTGLAHAVYNGFTILPSTEKYGHLHGEIVSYGVLVLLTVDKQFEALKKMHDFSESMGLPTKLEHLHAAKEDMDAVIEKAFKGIDLRVWPYEVTAEMIKDAVKYLEEYK